MNGATSGPFRGIPSLALLVVALLGVVACFTPPPPRGAPPELEDLYDKVQECRADYERGLELMVIGDSVMGRNMLNAATTRLAFFAEECAARPGCDVKLFERAMADLIHGRRTARARGVGEPLPNPDVDDTLDGGPVVDAIPEISRTVNLLRGTDLRDLITLNDRVRAALNDWLTWNRPALIEAYENYQFLRLDVAPIYAKAGLPEALLFAMMTQETGVKAHAYSPAGAVGPLQFMHHTARRYGLHYVDGFDMRLDPVAATKANARFLNDQFNALNEDLEKVLAAYNGGESRLRALHRKLDGAEFWDPELYYALPTETRDYVPQILAAAWLFLHPEEYGLEFPSFESNTITIQLRDPISLDELTVCLGHNGSRSGWFRTLRNLNPRLRTGKRIPAGAELTLPSRLVPVYERQCLGDARLLTIARELHAAAYAPKPEAAAGKTYTVRPGDTLAAIAKRLGCSSVRKLADANGLTPPRYVIQVGQNIRVPDCG